ncbi:MAG: ComEC/Rec2 family competence protein [Alphaproteobacteria bacterium]|nr:ComEC/Rec2 family competence protein [Alphaproteobacteria bacterium]
MARRDPDDVADRGAATGAIGAYHFHRIAPLGPLINLIAMPLVSVLVMPMAVLALALLPFGLEVLPLSVMGLALEQVAGVSSWAQEATPDEGVIGALPPPPFSWWWRVGCPVPRARRLSAVFAGAAHACRASLTLHRPRTCSFPKPVRQSPCAPPRER